jgi:L-serine dehydratase
MLANEVSQRPAGQVRSRLLEIWAVMRQCVEARRASPGVLPGGLNVPRRAPELFSRLTTDPDQADPLQVMDWVNLFAIAVNEENAAGGRVVTVPT